MRKPTSFQFLLTVLLNRFRVIRILEGRTPTAVLCTSWLLVRSLPLLHPLVFPMVSADVHYRAPRPPHLLSEDQRLVGRSLFCLSCQLPETTKYLSDISSFYPAHGATLIFTPKCMGVRVGVHSYAIFPALNIHLRRLVQ